MVKMAGNKLINFESPVVLKDLEYICELALMGIDRENVNWDWQARINRYRRLLKEEIENANDRHKQEKL